MMIQSPTGGLAGDLVSFHKDEDAETLRMRVSVPGKRVHDVELAVNSHRAHEWIFAVATNRPDALVILMICPIDAKDPTEGYWNLLLNTESYEAAEELRQAYADIMALANRPRGEA